MIVVTTPTGNIGRQVLTLLLASGEKVRAIVRDPARIPEATRDRVEIVQGTHDDPAVVEKAFDGAEAVFWLVPPAPRAESLEAAYVEFTRPACEAFRQRGVERVVGVSALGRGFTENAGLVTASLAMDDLIAGSGVAYRALLLPSFMDNLLRQVESIKNQGVFFSPLAGDRKFPTCATRDIAAAAARLLTGRDWSGSGGVAVLGPEDLSFEDMARILSAVLEKPLRFQQIPFEAYRARLEQNGMSPVMAQGMVDMMKAKNAGLDNAEPRTPESSSPTSFRQFCEEVMRPAILG